MFEFLKIRRSVELFSNEIDREINSFFHTSKAVLAIEILMGYVDFASSCIFVARRTLPRQTLGSFAKRFRYKISHGHHDNLPIIYDNSLAELESRFGTFPVKSDLEIFQYSAKRLVCNHRTEGDKPEDEAEIEAAFVSIASRLLQRLTTLLRDSL